MALSGAFRGMRTSAHWAVLPLSAIVVLLDSVRVAKETLMVKEKMYIKIGLPVCAVQMTVHPVERHPSA